jgi:hypothetical protein
MEVGEVTFNQDGSVATRTGLAGALYDARIGAMIELGRDTSGGARAELAAFARADAFAIINYLRANAQAVVSVGGLQTTPTPNDPGTPTLAPTARVYLPIE